MFLAFGKSKNNEETAQLGRDSNATVLTNESSIIEETNDTTLPVDAVDLSDESLVNTIALIDNNNVRISFNI